MISAVIAIFVAQAGPMIIARPIVRAPTFAAPVLELRKQQFLAEGRDLLARAERSGQTYTPAPGQPTKADLDASIDQLKADLDSMSEMGEMESLRLQMAMDRMSKMMATLSNLLKKSSDTASGITSNLK